MRQRLWTLIACLILPIGCSTTSSIQRINGPEVEGDIVGGSPDSIFVDTPGQPDYEIPRQDVASIDYPGNVHTNVGAGVLAYGALNIALGFPDCRDRTEQQAAFCVGVFTPAVLGAAMIVWGLVVEKGQRAGVRDMSRPSRLKATPAGAR